MTIVMTLIFDSVLAISGSARVMDIDWLRIIDGNQASYDFYGEDIEEARSHLVSGSVAELKEKILYYSSLALEMSRESLSEIDYGGEHLSHTGRIEPLVWVPAIEGLPPL